MLKGVTAPNVPSPLPTMISAHAGAPPASARSGFPSSLKSLIARSIRHARGREVVVRGEGSVAVAEEDGHAVRRSRSP